MTKLRCSRVAFRHSTALGDLRMAAVLVPDTLLVLIEPLLPKLHSIRLATLVAQPPVAIRLPAVSRI